MQARRLFAGFCVWVLAMAAASPAMALANRVFVSARSGNDPTACVPGGGGCQAPNTCDTIASPCQTFAGAVTQLNPDGVVIVLDSGDYGPVTITQGVTIAAPAGVTAFVHPPSGADGITVNAGSATVTLRGLTLNRGTGNGVTVTSVGTLNVENCFITGFIAGIQMFSGGRLNVKGTDIKACSIGVFLFNSTGVVQASIDGCHLDGNFDGFVAQTASPGGSTTTASYTTANNNGDSGWVCGNFSSGKDVLNLEFCTGSENGSNGLAFDSFNALTVARYSNCVFANNGNFGVVVGNPLATGTVETRGNNTITGNTSGPTSGTIGTFSPM